MRWFLIGKAKTSVIICFEDVVPKLARRAATPEVDFLLNLTNDGWFDIINNGSTPGRQHGERLKTGSRWCIAVPTALQVGWTSLGDFVM